MKPHEHFVVKIRKNRITSILIIGRIIIVSLLLYLLLIIFSVFFIKSNSAAYRKYEMNINQRLTLDHASDEEVEIINRLADILSKSALDSLVLQGVQREEVDKIYGEPVASGDIEGLKWTEYDLRRTYPFLQGAKGRVGFVGRFKDGQLFEWNESYRYKP
jgi:hypothetical protein